VYNGLILIGAHGREKRYWVCRSQLLSCNEAKNTAGAGCIIHRTKTTAHVAL
jgi:hypothetical protein